MRSVDAFGRKVAYISGPFFKPESAYLTNDGYPLGTTCWYFEAWHDGLRSRFLADAIGDAWAKIDGFVESLKPSGGLWAWNARGERLRFTVDGEACVTWRKEVDLSLEMHRIGAAIILPTLDFNQAWRRKLAKPIFMPADETAHVVQFVDTWDAAIKQFVPSHISAWMQMVGLADDFEQRDWLAGVRHRIAATAFYRDKPGQSGIARDLPDDWAEKAALTSDPTRE